MKYTEKYTFVQQFACSAGVHADWWIGPSSRCQCINARGYANGTGHPSAVCMHMLCIQAGLHLLLAELRALAHGMKHVLLFAFPGAGQYVADCSGLADSPRSPG